MTIRAVSDLAQISSLQEDDLFGVSQRVADGYASYKIKYESLESGIVDASVEKTKEEFDLDGFSGSDVNDQLTVLNSIGTITDSTLTFNNPPIVNQYANDDNEIPNLGQVYYIAKDRTAYIGTDSYITSNPNNDSGYTAYSDNLMLWQFDHNTKDSTLFKNSYGQYKYPNGIRCNRTGMLTIYGWLADNGNVKANEAWVGLYGKICTASSSSQWVLLQVQPWIVGKNSQVMQYVGFNIPVKEGLYLKIKTGFQVNGNNSGLQKDNSLMFVDQGNVVNTFIGYVIGKD